MYFPFYIARRYLIARKSQQAINIITLISVIGVAIGAMGLFIVLSVFNGFQDVILGLFNSFDPGIKITASKGKTFHYDKNFVHLLESAPGIKNISPVVEENALIRYKEKQYLCSIKGVGPAFQAMTGVDSMIIEGKFILSQDSIPFAIPGAGIADALGISVRDILNPIEIYVPRRGKDFSLNPEEAFNRASVLPSGIFSIQQEFDVKYMLVPISLARRILDYSDEVSSLELGTTDPNATKAFLEKHLGRDYQVKTREEQHELLYKIMKSEKWAVFLILSFILIIATFNVIGSLTMLILDKKKDINILWGMGCDTNLMRMIFFLEGMLIAVSGGVIGLAAGLIICFLQQKFGFITMQGSFVVDSYPVTMKIRDFFAVLGTVLLTGGLATWYPVVKLLRKNEERKLVFSEVI